jgi:hypothetical protein
MTDQDRFENAESVRDFYRYEGEDRERERIIKLMMNEPVSPELYKVIQKLKGETNDLSN